ncbi:MAG: helix-turn-helix domain-containing protein [Planctomycetes bacterium]|nr:helix-turn-helix domain-containing protein [Planctomycetota bacterium]
MLLIAWLERLFVDFLNTDNASGDGIEKNDNLKLNTNSRMALPESVQPAVPGIASRYFDSKQAAKFLGISVRHLWTLKNQNLIPWFPLGRCVRYSPEVINAYLTEQMQKKGKRR